MRQDSAGKPGTFLLHLIDGGSNHGSATLLCTSSGADQTAKSDSKTKGYSIEDLENKFAALDVEEPIERSDDAQLTNSKTPEPFYELELPKNKENAEAEKLFALFCLFDDFQSLRTFVMELWTGYGAGRVDLITASVSTNAAFQLALRTQEEMQAAYPECGDYQSKASKIRSSFSALIWLSIEAQLILLSP